MQSLMRCASSACVTWKCRPRPNASGEPRAASRRAHRLSNLGEDFSMPMLLRGSPLSPYARKVRMAILHLGLTEKIEFVRADPMNPEDVLRRDNPLGKIPVLMTEDGKAVYDSRVILEYLDHAAGGGIIIPDSWPARRDTLTMQAMCDGIMDACILIIYEARHRPPAIHHQPWLDYQRGKVVRGLKAFANAPPDPARFDV